MWPSRLDVVGAVGNFLVQHFSHIPEVVLIDHVGKETLEELDQFLIAYSRRRIFLHRLESRENLDDSHGNGDG